MVDEIGHGGIPGQPLQSLVKNLHRVAHTIWDAKWKLHEVLHGDEVDEMLLIKAGELLRKLEREVVKPVGRIKTFGPNSIVKIRSAGREAAKIAASAERFHRQAEMRCRAALTSKSDVSSEKGAVVSLDMARYSEFALDLESFLNARVLFEFNEDIKHQFEKAIKSAGGDPEATPILNTGDGALIFFKNSEFAIRFALGVQAEAFQRNLKIRSKGRKRRFRIGIAVGEYCLQAHSDISGRLLGFNAAGVTIIDAVRIQAKCREGEILVSKATFDDLPDDLKRRFNRPRPIKTKQHEKRAIEVRVLRRSSAG